MACLLTAAALALLLALAYDQARRDAYHDSKYASPQRLPGDDKDAVRAQERGGRKLPSLDDDPAAAPDAVAHDRVPLPDLTDRDLEAVAAVAGAPAVAWYRPWEARYRGRPTSDWAQEYQGLDWLTSVACDSEGCHFRVEGYSTRRLGGRVDQSLLRGDPAAVAVLGELLARPEHPSRMAAAYGLRRVGPAARAAVPRLLAAVEDEDDEVSFLAVQAMFRVDPDALAAHSREARRTDVPGLVGQLASPHVRVRRRAAVRLEELGDKGQPALPALRRTLADPDERVRLWAAEAVLKIAPEAHADVVPALAALLAGRDNFHRAMAANRLGDLGARARPAVPALLRLLADPEHGPREAARRALREIDPAALAAYDRAHPQEELP
jgi:hypothetical protein